MFCANCGKALSQGAVFCGACGTKVSQNVPRVPAPDMPNVQLHMTGAAITGTQPGTPSGKKRITLVVLALILLILGIAVFIIFQTIVNPAMAATRAIDNMTDEMTQRIDNTPFRAVGMLMDTLEDGRVAVDFNYQAGWLGTQGSFTLDSNTQRNEYALIGQVGTFGFMVDFEAHVNAQRAAFGSRMLGGDLYGITYRTFRQDIRPFAEFIGLDNHGMNRLADFVEAFEKSMSQPSPNFSDFFLPYEDILSSFILRGASRPVRTEIRSGGQDVRVSKISLTATDSDIADLLNDLYDQLEEDENIRAYFENMLSAHGLFLAVMLPAFPGYSITDDTAGFSHHDMFLNEIRDMIRDFERYVTGDIIWDLYIGQGDRLIRADLDIDMTVDRRHMGLGRERVGLLASFYFGLSIYDSWEFDLTFIDGANRERVFFVWGYSDGSRGIENTLTVSTGLDAESESAAMSSHWSPDSGRFTLSYRDQWDSGSLSGVFNVQRGGFNLQLDHLPMGGNNTLSLDITASPGAQFEPITFINISQWSHSIMGNLLDLLRRFIF